MCDEFWHGTGTASTLHGLVTPVLPVVTVWSAGAHGTRSSVDDATSPVRPGQVGLMPAVEVAFGE
jgi:hypothetical protein